MFLLALSAAGYVSAGSPRISYAGFQIAFAFFLCVIQGPSPAFDISIARDRVIGILLGDLVVALVFTNLWPVTSASASIRRSQRCCVDSLPWSRRRVSHIARSPLRRKRRSQRSSRFDLARYEPNRSGRPAGWPKDARSPEIVALEGPLLISADQDAAAFAGIAIGWKLLADRSPQAEATRRAHEEAANGGSRRRCPVCRQRVCGDWK